MDARGGMVRVHAGRMNNPAHWKEYGALEGEFALAAALIRARAPWEGGKVLPSTHTIARQAKATGTRLQISFALPQ